MEEDRKMMPATSMIGGFYAKAKQRVLNRIGRRTSTYFRFDSSTTSVAKLRMY